MASASRILFVVASYGTTGWYRCNVPGQALAKRGHTCHLDVAADMNTSAEYDLLVFSNPSTDLALASIRYAKAAGKRIVVDFDECPWRMTDMDAELAPRLEQERPFVEACLAEADLVTTTNPFLADFLTPFNSRVVILPNCLPGEWWNIERRPGNSTRIGWIGGEGQRKDLEMVVGPLKRLLEPRRDVEFHLTLFEDNPFEPKRQVKIIPSTRDLAGYPLLFSAIDIGIAPLVDNDFNRCRSDLKVLEYSGAGLAFVASSTPNYRNSVKHGHNGLLAGSEEEWVESLAFLLDNPEERARIASEARRFAEGRFIEKNVAKWERAYGLSSPG